jgi:hypothetical protein
MQMSIYKNWEDYMIFWLELTLLIACVFTSEIILRSFNLFILTIYEFVVTQHIKRSYFTNRKLVQI